MRMLPRLGFPERVPVYIGACMAIAIMTLQMLALKHPPFAGFGSAHREAQDVQNYVLFTDSAAGELTVKTGTEYASTSTRKISRQWCYVERPSSSSERIVTIASIDESGALSRPHPSSEAIAALGLTEAEIDDLASSHCRFQ